MLYGALSFQTYPAPTPAWWPAGALAFADFVNGRYGIGGVEKTLGNLFSGVDAADIDANGLAAWYANLSRPAFTSALLGEVTDNAAAGLTFVLELDFAGQVDGANLLSLYDNVDPYSASNYAAAYVNSPNEIFGVYDAASLSGEDGDTYDNGLAVMRYAVTFGRDLGGGSYANESSKNGSAVADLGSTAYAAIAAISPLAAVYMGVVDATGNSLSTAYIRKMEIWPAQSQADLRILSASGIALSIDGAPLADAMNGLAYVGFSVAAHGGKPDYAFSIASGSLPPGLSLDSASGAVSGTPTTNGTYSGIVIRVTDSLGATADLAAFTITVRDFIISKTAEASGSTAAGSIDFGTLDFGIAAGDRVIAVAIASSCTSSHTVTGVTIGGNAASIVETITQPRCATIAYLAVPAGASGNITVAFDQANVIAHVAVFEIHGLTTAVQDSTNNYSGTSVATLAATIAVPDGGVVLAVGTDGAGGRVGDWPALVDQTNYDGSNYIHCAALGHFETGSGTGAQNFDFNIDVAAVSMALAIASFN